MNDLRQLSAQKHKSTGQTLFQSVLLTCGLIKIIKDINYITLPWDLRTSKLLRCDNGYSY